MQVLVQHMSANGDHLSAESFEWLVDLFFFCCSSQQIRTLSATLMLLPLLRPRWGSRCQLQSLLNLLPKPRATMAPKAKHRLMTEQKALKPTATNAARTCDQLVLQLSSQTRSAVSRDCASSRVCSVRSFAASAAASLPLLNLNSWERMCVHEAATGEQTALRVLFWR
jgi:hypothetical protein